MSREIQAENNDNVQNITRKYRDSYFNFIQYAIQHNYALILYGLPFKIRAVQVQNMHFGNLLQILSRTRPENRNSTTK
jgi:hypothetical protein